MPSGSRLLVVDDEAELMDVLREMLAGQGYETLGFTSAREALEALKEQPFDLLLTDLMMPEMDGIALLRATLEIDPDLVGIVMTGQGTIQTAVDAMKIGAFDYVLKPFKLSALMPVLSRAMQLRQLRAENLQLRETLAIYELGKAIAFTLDMDTILNKMADAALQQCQADEASVMLPTCEGNELYIATVRGDNRWHLRGQRVPLGLGIAGWVARCREPLVLRGQVRDPRFAPVRPRAEIQSAISMPMMVGGKLIGVLNVNATRSRRPLTLGQVKALTILASTAAPALEGAWLYAQVREAEEKYRSIFENAVEGIYQVTPEGRFLTVNPAMARMLGYPSPEEFMSHVGGQQGTPPIGPTRRPELLRLLQAQEVVSGFESQARRRDGTPIWVSENCRAVRDAEGKLLFYEGTVEDITDRKLAEEALRDSERRYRNIVEMASEGIWAIDADRRTTFVNQQMAEMLGYKIDEMLGQRMDSFLFEEDLADHRKQMAAREKGLAARYERRVRHKDSSALWAIVSAAPLLDGEGRFAGSFAMYTDISDRKRVEGALIEALQTLKTLVDSAPVAILILDTEGRVIEWNRAATRMFGWSKEEVLGKVNPIIPPDRYEEFHRLRQRALGGESFSDHESRRMKRDGSLVDVSISVAPLRDFQGQTTGVVSVLVDTSERRGMEERLARAQRLEAAGRIAGQVAHDFNNLLVPLAAYPELIRMQLPEGHTAVQYCDSMLQAASQMAAINDDLLTLGRRGRVEREVVDLDQLLKQAIGMMSRLPDGLTVELDLAADLLPISGAPSQLLRVIANLISNARDAMQDGGILHISAENVYLDSPFGRYNLVETGEYVRLQVADTGCGIPPEIRDRIFDAFFTTKRTDEKRGSGLGLAIVQAILEDHRGYVDLESEVGNGTTFSLYLPVHRGHARETRGDGLPGGSESILLVDDDRQQREVLGEMLRTLGYRVEVAESGEKAIDLLKERAADLLILDMAMPPGIDGVETYRRALRVRPGQRAIVVSGFALPERVQEAHAVGAGAYLPKPVSLAGLARAVRGELDGLEWRAR